jgi:hypothetical protein
MLSDRLYLSAHQRKIDGTDSQEGAGDFTEKKLPEI